MPQKWTVEFTDEFELWWSDLTELVQEKCAVVVDLLAREGPNLFSPRLDVYQGPPHETRKKERHAFPSMF